MAGLQLSTHSWKKSVRRCSQQWRQMSDQDKEPYHAIAAEEQGFRHEAMRQPFKSAEGREEDSFREAGFDAAAHIPKNGLSTISLHRLLATYQRFKSSPVWGSFEAGLASPDGAMSLDHIDLETTPEEVSRTWANFIRPAKEEESEACNGDDAGDLHHSVCGQGHGLCRSMPCYEIACKFASSMHGYMKEGRSPDSNFDRHQ